MSDPYQSAYHQPSARKCRRQNKPWPWSGTRTSSVRLARCAWARWAHFHQFHCPPLIWNRAARSETLLVHLYNFIGEARLVWYDIIVHGTVLNTLHSNFSASIQWKLTIAENISHLSHEFSEFVVLCKNTTNTRQGLTCIWLTSLEYAGTVFTAVACSGFELSITRANPRSIRSRFRLYRIGRFLPWITLLWAHYAKFSWLNSIRLFENKKKIMSSPKIFALT